MKSLVMLLILCLTILSPFLLLSQIPSEGASDAKLPRTELIQSLIKEAQAADTEEGMEDYSKLLIKMLVGDQAGAAYATALSHRLAVSELMARHGKRKLIPESSVAQAFNELMKQVGAGPAPPIETNPLIVHQLRVAVYNTSPVLSSLDSHSSECLPSEAVFLMWLLCVNDGAFSIPIPPGGAKPGVSIRQNAPIASSLIYRYSASHSHFETVKLYDHVVQFIGF
jgi:hypothetical protein